MKQAVCILIENPLSGKVLCVSRGADLENWGLPGGKVDVTDNSLIDAAVRELREETGLYLQPDQLTEVFDMECKGAVDYHAHTFKVNPNQQILNYNFTSSPEGTVSWREWDDLLDDKSSFREYNLALCERLNDMEDHYP